MFQLEETARCIDVYKADEDIECVLGCKIDQPCSMHRACSVAQIGEDAFKNRSCSTNISIKLRTIGGR